MLPMHVGKPYNQRLLTSHMPWWRVLEMPRLARHGHHKKTLGTHYLNLRFFSFFLWVLAHGPYRVIAVKWVQSGHAVPSSMPCFNKSRKRHAQIMQHCPGSILYRQSCQDPNSVWNIWVEGWSRNISFHWAGCLSSKFWEQQKRDPHAWWWGRTSPTILVLLHALKRQKQCRPEISFFLWRPLGNNVCFIRSIV